MGLAERTRQGEVGVGKEHSVCIKIMPAAQGKKNGDHLAGCELA